MALLLLFGLSLLVPGISEMFRFVAFEYNTETISQANQHRALHGMMAGLGLLACIACFSLERARLLVLGLGLTLLLVMAGRIYSLAYDGIPSGLTLFYLFVEACLALIFLLFPPPVTRPTVERSEDDSVREYHKS